MWNRRPNEMILYAMEVLKERTNLTADREMYAYIPTTTNTKPNSKRHYIQKQRQIDNVGLRCDDSE